MGVRRRATLIVVALVAASLLSTRIDATADTTTTVVRSGAVVATVNHDPFGITVTQHGETLLDSRSAGITLPTGPSGPLSFALGARAGVQPPLAGYGLFADLPLVWFHATTARPNDDGSLLVHTTDPTRTWTLRVTAASDGVVAFDAALSDATGVLATSGTFASDPRQRFLGFGERSEAADLTGRVVENWNEEGPFSAGAVRPLTDPVLGEDWPGPPPFGPASNFTMPWFVSSRGYGFLLDSTWLNRFDLRDPSQWRVETAQPALNWRVYGGPTPAHVVARATNDPLIGRQPEPAEWFFGPWYQPNGDNAFRESLLKGWRTPREQGGLDVPVTVAQTYTHYLPCAAQAGGRATGADRKRAALYHDWGYRITTYVNSFVCQDHPDGAYAAGEANGWFVKTALGFTYPLPYLAYLDASSAVVDFTAPGAIEWWQSLINEALADGYDGWMEDFGEYVPPDAVLADGRSGIEGHNDYCTAYHRASHELTAPLRGRDFAQFVRCGYTGTGPVARIVWGGDPTEDDSEADGLAAAVSQGLSMGVSGIAYWGSDIGGFHSLFTDGRTSAELLVRWLEFGAFSGIMRTQADGFARPGQGGRRAQVWDPEVLPHWRATAQLRTQLFPYIWRAALEYQHTGMPMMRHLALAFPDDPVVWGLGDPEAVDAARFEFLFGRDLLVAPVVNLGETTKQVWLPAGDWVSFWDEAGYDAATGEYTERAGIAPTIGGRRLITVDAPLGRTPLFVRAGTCIPFLPADVDTLDNRAGFAHDADIVTLAEGIDRIRQIGFGTNCD